jgi:anti-anti-sigma regulatory factor
MVTNGSVLGSLSGRRRAGAQDCFGTSDHACWAYRSTAERGQAAAEWLADGLQRGQRGVYVADDTVDDLVIELAGVPDRDARIRRGELVVYTISDLYDLSRPIDAAAQLSAYAAAVDQAFADGFDGLRVAADITALVAEPARRPAHLRWEQVADRYISGHPLAPLCLYDAWQVDEPDAIARCHPLQGPTAAPCALYGVSDASGALVGELDSLDDTYLVELLTGQPESDYAVDVSGVTFIDAGSTWVLHKHVLDRRSSGHPVALTDPSPILQRMWTLCGFDPSLLDGPRADASPEEPLR